MSTIRILYGGNGKSEPEESNLCLDVNHEGITVPVVVKFYYEPEEKPTSDCPGSEEDFEITEITFDEDFDVANLLDECFEMNIPEIAAWFEGLEKSIMKEFHDKIEKMKNDQEDYYEQD